MEDDDYGLGNVTIGQVFRAYEEKRRADEEAESRYRAVWNMLADVANGAHAVRVENVTIKRYKAMCSWLSENCKTGQMASLCLSQEDFNENTSAIVVFASKETAALFKTFYG